MYCCPGWAVALPGCYRLEEPLQVWELTYQNRYLSPQSGDTMDAYPWMLWAHPPPPTHPPTRPADPHTTPGSTLNHWPFPWRHLPEAYCYLLTHCGTPCVFYDHFYDPGLKQVSGVGGRASPAACSCLGL